MKAFVILFSFAGIIKAQTIVTKTYPVKSGQEIHLKFDYPETIRISTWDKPEVFIQASVTVNNGKNDTSFVLQEKYSPELISISNKPFNVKTLSRPYTLVLNGQTKTFVTKEMLKEYLKTNDENGNKVSQANTIDISIEIKVPAHTPTHLKSVYGLVELNHFNGPVNVVATYGGIDASLSEKETGNLSVSVNYGEIYSNLHLDIIDKTDEAFHTAFKAKYGTGARVNLESNYGNIYLRQEL